MNNKKLSFILLTIMCLITISALDNLGTFKQNECVEIRQTCATCTYINASVIYPNSSVAVNNTALTNIGSGVFTYTFCETTLLGRYDIVGLGNLDGDDSSFATYFQVSSQGDIYEKGLTETSLYILIAIIVSFVMYFSVSKLIGSMGIFLTGFGLLLKSPQEGWIGWIVIASGFIMLLYSLMGSNKKKRIRRMRSNKKKRIRRMRR